MAFGSIRRRRRRRQRAEEGRRREQQQLESDIEEAQDPEKISEEVQRVQTTVSGLEEADEEPRRRRRERSQQEAREDVTEELPGLSEEQKRALRESARAQIGRSVEQQQRMLRAQQGRRGQRGGAADRQLMELQRGGLEAQQQADRDIIEQDQDVSMRRLAAYLASLEGRKAEDLLRRQQYIDYITSRQDQKKQDIYSRYYNRRF